MRRSSVPRLIAMALVLACATTGWLTVQAARQTTASSKVIELMRKRLDLASSLSGLMNNAFAAGHVSASACHEANLTYLDAEMELCTTDAERVKVQQKVLDAVKAQEMRIEKDHKSGNLMATDVIKAQLVTLEAEIVLEKLKAKPAGK